MTGIMPSGGERQELTGREEHAGRCGKMQNWEAGGKVCVLQDYWMLSKEKRCVNSLKLQSRQNKEIVW